MVQWFLKAEKLTRINKGFQSLTFGIKKESPLEMLIMSRLTRPIRVGNVTERRLGKIAM